MVRIGDVVSGTITGIQSYGIFVQINESTQGLIHVSEIKAGYIKNIHDIFSLNQKVTVQVIDVDEFSQKISLSIRSLKQIPKNQPKFWKKYFTNKDKHIGFETLKKSMPIWIKEDLNYLNEKIEKGSSIHDE